MTQPTPATAAFRAARDLLLSHREDYDAAMREFAWPELDGVQLGAGLVRRDRGRAPRPGGAAGGRRGRHHHADLRRTGGQVEPGGQLAARPRRPARRPAAAHARQHRPAVGGHPRRDQARRGDHPGQDPAQPRRPGRPDRPRQRPARGDRDGAAGEVPGLAGLGAGGWTPPGAPGARRRRPGRGIATRRRSAHPAEFAPDGPTPASDPLLLYFTSGTTAQPKLVEHTHVSYPVGHLSTVYWIGLQPGDVHLNISSPGWAKHAWSNVFAPWNAEATTLILGYERFNAEVLLKALGEQRREHVLRAAHRVADAHPGRPRRRRRQRAARVRRRGRAAQPGGHRAGPRGVAHHRPRRVRPDRDDRAGREPPGPAAEARLDGPAAARLHGGAGRPDHRRARARTANSASTCPAARSA